MLFHLQMINKESFSVQAQQTTSHTDQLNDLEQTMSNLSVDDTYKKNSHISSNSLQTFPDQNFNMPRFQHYSSQALNFTSPMKTQMANRNDPGMPSFTQIASVPTSLPVTLTFDLKINEEFEMQQVQCSQFLDPDSNQVIYFCYITEEIVLYDYNWWISCKVYLPPTTPGAMWMQEKLYTGYINLFELREISGQNISLSLFAEDESQLLVNLNYINDFQFQRYKLSNLAINLKFPIMRHKPPVQRNSFYSLSSMAGPPPGLGKAEANKMGMESTFGNKGQLNYAQMSRISPPSDWLLPPDQRKPKTKRSCQNVVKPLVNESELNHMQIEKKSSDSISDNDQYQIKEEDDDDSLEEQKAESPQK